MGLQQGAVYTLTGPDGTAAVFNDSAHPNYVGLLTEPPAGLDSPEVRGQTNPVAQGDGAYHGSYFYGFRPVTLTGLIPPNAPVAVLNDRIERLQRASAALRGDAALSWTEAGEPYARVVRQLRRQQPTRVSGGRQKTFIAQLVSAEHLILSGADLSDSAGVANGADAVITNDGNGVMAPRISWTPPAGAQGPRGAIFENVTTGEQLRIKSNIEYLATLPLVLDLAARTFTVDGGSKYGDIDYVNSDWWGLAPGANTIRITDSNLKGGSFTVTYRHAWV